MEPHNPPAHSDNFVHIGYNPAVNGSAAALAAAEVAHSPAASSDDHTVAEAVDPTVDVAEFG